MLEVSLIALGTMFRLFYDACGKWPNDPRWSTTEYASQPQSGCFGRSATYSTCWRHCPSLAFFSWIIFFPRQGLHILSIHILTDWAPRVSHYWLVRYFTYTSALNSRLTTHADLEVPICFWSCCRAHVFLDVHVYLIADQTRWTFSSPV